MSTIYFNEFITNIGLNLEVSNRNVFKQYIVHGLDANWNQIKLTKNKCACAKHAVWTYKKR